ncbi:hypothetical protein V1264_012202 [Littorina saxatilis]|uniref:Ankyrin repeat domain-containing protein 54 n=2 Tax=Littorina saxatilis TaxID=31220 RepID=A0AAN9BWM8_9CAEN
MYRNANDDHETEERCKSSSSSEGEYHVSTGQTSSSTEFQIPNFSAIQDWNPTGPAGLQYMCLLALPLPHTTYCTSTAEQTPHVNKVKVSVTHRQQRLREFKLGHTTGKNIHDEKKLQRAASENRFETVIELLESGIDPCCHDNKQRTALHFAASQGNDLIVKVLLDKGADPNSKDILGNTPMHLAAITGHVPVVTLLLKAGTNVQSVDKNGRTPLHLAKARLKVLSNNTSCSSTQLKEEVTQVSEMMKTYLNISGMGEASEQVDQLCKRLEQSSTREEVDAVNTLLSGFTGLSIKKDSEPG